MTADDWTMDRRHFLSATSAAIIGATLAGAAPAGASAGNCRRRPNIVFVLCDDLGWGEIGAYGQEIIRTPNIDRMAAEGVRFTDFYSAAPICGPSRCCAMTGVHQGHARIRANELHPIQASLNPEDVTFGEVVKAGGYATGIFGKWGFGPDDRAPNAGPSGVRNEGHFSHPLQKGFDEFAGFVAHHHSTHGYWADYWWVGNERVEVPENAGAVKDDTGTPTAPVRGHYMPDDYVGRALDFIDRHANEPFLLWLSLQLPHTPNEVPDWSEYDHLPYANDTKKHAAMVTLADRYVGMLRAKVEELGLGDDTIFLFTSDNGAHDETPVYGGTDPIPQRGVTSAADVAIFNSNGPFRGVKQNIYEGGIRQPLVVWGPGVLDASLRGATVPEPFAMYDFMPTFAEFAGVEPPSDVDGVSLVPLLTGNGIQRSHDFLYWERFSSATPTLFNSVSEPGRQFNFVQAVRRGRWKLVRWAPSAARDGAVGPVNVPEELWHKELYDLRDDPGETTNLLALQPRVAEELVAIMEREHVPPPFERQPYRPRMTGPCSPRRRRRRGRA